MNNENTSNQTLAEVEKNHIEAVLIAQKHNKTKTAKALGISRGAVQYKLKQYFNTTYVSPRSK